MYQIKDKHFTSNLYKTKVEAIHEWEEYLFNNKEEYKVNDLTNLYFNNKLVYQWKIAEGKDEKYLNLMHDNGYSGYLEIVPNWD